MTDFGPLTLVVAAALIGPMLAATGRFGPPVVVGEIAAGAIIGRSGLNLVDPSDPLLTGLAAIGLAVLMFVVGTHLPVRDARLRATLPTGLGVLATVAGLSALAGVLLASATNLDRPALLGVLVATSSGAVALPVLQGLANQDRTTLVLTVWIAGADVATVVALPITLNTGGPARVLLGAAAVMATAGTLFLIARQLRPRRAVQALRNRSRQLGWGLDLRLSLLALFGCAWLATTYGASVLFAGFAVGGAVALLGEPRRVADQLIGVGEGFAIPLFFVHLGAQLDLGAFITSGPAVQLAILIAAAAIITHLVAALLWRLPIGGGLLATAQLGVPSAAASVGLASGILTTAQAAAVLAAMVLSLAACAVGAAVLGHGDRLPEAAAPLR